MCPTGNGMSKRATGQMSGDIYLKIINEAEKYNAAIRFIRCGEPTLHKTLIDFIKLAKTKNILCHLNTNGAILTENYIIKILNSGLDSIKFSLQGINLFGYNEMRLGGNYNAIINSIKTLYALRGNEKKPYIHISTTVTCEKQNEIKQFKKEMKSFCDLVTVGKTVLDYINIEETTLDAAKKTILANLMRKESVNKIHPHCPEVFDKLSIDWDGSVTACCWDYNRYMLIGYIGTHSLKEIWECKKLNAYRNILYNMNHDSLKLCKNCYDYIELKH
jgi:MoaA/NifB/PqqE/SkfB family radical SAM enzyme